MPHERHSSLPIPLIVLALVVTSAVLVGWKIGFGAALLLLAGATLVLAIALLWSSVQNLTGEAPMTLEEALTLGAPSAEDERKRAVLRALKDLEFERSVGKLSEEDYAIQSARYRQEAKELLRNLEESQGEQRARIEQRLAERLNRTGETTPRRSKKKRRAADQTRLDPADTSSSPTSRASSDELTDAPVSTSSPAAAAEGIQDDAPASTRSRDDATANTHADKPTPDQVGVDELDAASRPEQRRET